MIAKNQSEFGQNILSVTERSYLALLENAMDYLSMMLILENTGFWYFFAYSAVLLIFLPAVYFVLPSTENSKNEPFLTY